MYPCQLYHGRLAWDRKSSGRTVQLATRIKDRNLVCLFDCRLRHCLRICGLTLRSQNAHQACEERRLVHISGLTASDWGVHISVRK